LELGPGRCRRRDKLRSLGSARRVTLWLFCSPNHLKIKAKRNIFPTCILFDFPYFIGRNAPFVADINVLLQTASHCTVRNEDVTAMILDSVINTVFSDSWLV
jgi:hypothetical protein